jgi:general secretion pathway protein M
MKPWWNSLNRRERWLVAGGAGLVPLFLVYTLIWHPFHTRLQTLRQTVAAQRQELAWMRQAAVEIKSLEATTSSSRPRREGQQSLLTLVDQSARTAGLGTALKRIEPQGEDKLRVQFEQVGFDQLIHWLGSLEQAYGVTLVNATVDRQTESGRVDARLVLQGSAS